MGVTTKGQRKTHPAIRKFPASIGNPPIFCALKRSVGHGAPFRGGRTSPPNNRRGNTKYAKPPQMGAAPKGNTCPAQEPLNRRFLVAIPLFLRSKAPLGVPGIVPRGPRITAQQPTRKHYIGVTAVNSGWRRKENKRPGGGSLDFRFLVAIPLS